MEPINSTIPTRLCPNQTSLPHIEEEEETEQHSQQTSPDGFIDNLKDKIRFGFTSGTASSSLLIKKLPSGFSNRSTGEEKLLQNLHSPRSKNTRKNKGIELNPYPVFSDENNVITKRVSFFISFFLHLLIQIKKCFFHWLTV